MVEQIKHILDDFIECKIEDSCDKCLAHTCVNDTNTTFCEMLLTYRGKLQDKINEVIEKN